MDGTDFFAVYEAIGEIVKRAREGGGPSLIECKTVRFHGHFEGDAQTYRGKGELEDIRADKDCIKIFRRRVREAGVVSEAEFDKIDNAVVTLIEQAVIEAKAAPLPKAGELLTDVYVAY